MRAHEPSEGPWARFQACCALPPWPEPTWPVDSISKFATPTWNAQTA
jgi:hypothetical protein